MRYALQMKHGRIKRNNPPPDNELNRKIILAIGKYLLSNPGSKDTEEGIQKWWLDRKFSDEEVRETLQWFVRKDWILQRFLPGGNPVFCINPDYKEDILDYLKKQKC